MVSARLGMCISSAAALMIKTMGIRSPQRLTRVFTQVFGASVGIVGYATLLSSAGLAQIIPDGSLGSESSLVNVGDVNGNPATVIDGGAERGANLFHSFSDFNVNAGQRVYFANPVDIENILSRVTGDGISNIDGLLGVDGNANLFLLNPNGVIFGPNASLDINGSLTVSTGESFTFADGSEFQAVPQGTELFTASVPLGVQFNNLSNPLQGDIRSEADLRLDQDLTLLAAGSIQTQNIDISNRNGDGGTITLAAEGDITTEDLNTSSLTSFVFSSDLVLAGNGGNIEVITTNGNVSMENLNTYSSSAVDGTKLINQRAGDGGNIRITATNGNITTDNINTYSSSLISGTDSTVGNSGNGGDIEVTTTNGNISTDNLDTSSFSEMFLSSESSLRSVVNLQSGDGGDIDVTTTDGNVSMGTLKTSSFSEMRSNSAFVLSAVNAQSGDGGDVEITTTNGNVSIEDVEALSRAFTSEGNFESGNGGDIKITTTDGDVSARSLLTYSLSLMFPNSVQSGLQSFKSENGSQAQNGGNIEITTTNGNVSVGDLLTFSLAEHLEGDARSREGGMSKSLQQMAIFL